MQTDQLKTENKDKNKNVCSSSHSNKFKTLNASTRVKYFVCNTDTLPFIPNDKVDQGCIKELQAMAKVFVKENEELKSKNESLEQKLIASEEEIRELDTGILEVHSAYEKMKKEFQKLGQ